VPLIDHANPTPRLHALPDRRSTRYEHDFYLCLPPGSFATAGTLDFSSFDSHARNFTLHERDPYRTRHPSLSGCQTGSVSPGLATGSTFSGQARSEPAIPMNPGNSRF